jgi:hypothetical protein
MFKRRSFLTYFSLASISSIFPVILAIFKQNQVSAEIVKDDISGFQSKDINKAGQKKLTGFTVVGSVSDLDTYKLKKLHSSAIPPIPNN